MSTIKIFESEDLIKWTLILNINMSKGTKICRFDSLYVVIATKNKEMYLLYYSNLINIIKINFDVLTDHLHL